MMMRMSNATLIGLTMVSALAFYTISLKVSAERGAVIDLQRKIARDTREIRQLEAELRTRASLPQLQRWNDDVLALTPASVKQYAHTPVQLAAYATQVPQPVAQQPAVALASAQPVAVPQPVQVAAPQPARAMASNVVQVAARTPQGPIRSGVIASVARASQPAPLTRDPVRVAKVDVAKVDVAKVDAVVRTVARTDKTAPAIVKVAAGKGGLLSDGFAKELEAAAAKEAPTVKATLR